MAENSVVTAEVTINSSRVNGSVKGGKQSSNSKELKVLKDMLKNMKEGTAIASKMSKVSLSGLGTGVAGLAAGGPVAAVLAGLSYFFGAGLSNFQNNGGNLGPTGFGAGGAGSVVGDMLFGSTGGVYQRAIIDGEEKVVEVNERTGEIVNVLTLREARERGILDANDQVYSNILANKGKWEKNTEHLDHEGSVLKLSTDELMNLLNEESLATNNMKEYNRLLKLRNDKLAASISKQFGGYYEGKSFVSESLHTTFINPTFMDLVNSQQAYLENATINNQQQSIQNVDNIFPYWEYSQ